MYETTTGGLSHLDRPDETVPGSADTVTTASQPRSAPESPPPSVAGPLLSLATVLAGVALLLGVALGAQLLQVVGALVLVGVGVGSACLVGVKGLDWLERAGVSILVGVSITILASTVMLATHSWHSAVLGAIVAVPVVIVHAVSLAGGGWTEVVDAARARVSLPRRLSRRTAPLVLATVGFMLACAAAIAHPVADPAWYGFLTTIGPVWYVGVALMAAAVLLLTKEADVSAWFVVTLLIVAVDLTASLVYSGPREPTATKHIDMIEQIRHFGRIRTNINVYEAWPGFFAFAAWICDLAGIKDPYSLAQYWPAMTAVLRVVALGYMIRAVVPSPRWAWTAALLVLLADPLGQDYLSPQSIGVLLAVLLYGLALRHRQMPQWATVALGLGAVALAVSHQLSPFVAGGALLILFALRQVSLRFPLALLGTAVVWTVAHRDSLTGFVSWQSMWHWRNFLPPKAKGVESFPRLPVVLVSVEAMVLGVLVLGVLALIGLWLRRRSLPAWAFAFASIAGFPLLLVTPYGQEGFFRATIFALPWLGLLAALGLASLRRPMWVSASALVALVATFLVASCALDPIRVIRSEDVAALRTVQQASEADPGKIYFMLDLVGGRTMPNLVPYSGAQMQTLYLGTLGLQVREEDPFTPSGYALKVTNWYMNYVGEHRSTRLYALWSPAAMHYDEAYGLQSRSQYLGLRDGLVASKQWRLVSNEGGTMLFELNGSSK